MEIAGAWPYENQIHRTNYFGQCSHFWSLLGCWKLDTLWKVLLSISLLAAVKISDYPSRYQTSVPVQFQYFFCVFQLSDDV